MLLLLGEGTWINGYFLYFYTIEILFFYEFLSDSELYIAERFLIFYIFSLRWFLRYNNDISICYLNIPWCNTNYLYFCFNYFVYFFYSSLYFSVNIDCMKKLVFGPLKFIFITQSRLRADAWLSTCRTSDANIYGFIFILYFAISIAIQNSYKFIKAFYLVAVLNIKVKSRLDSLSVMANSRQNTIHLFNVMFSALYEISSNVA